MYVKGLYLQGAGWDKKNANLVEADPMQLVCPMPTIHFKPVEGKRKTQRGELCEHIDSDRRLEVRHWTTDHCVMV